MDAEIRQIIERIKRAGPEACAMAAAALTPKPEPVKTVRVRRPFGGCQEVGVFVKATDKTITYRDNHGDVTRIGLHAKARSAGFPAPAPHTEPCVCCKDHPESRYGPGRCSTHGSVLHEGFGCETCAST